MRIYISGPRGEEFLQQFIDAQLALSGINGCTAVSYLNMHIPGNLQWAAQLSICIKELEKCQAVYMLRGWGTSLESRRELNRAMELRIPQYYEENNDMLTLLNMVNTGTT